MDGAAERSITVIVEGLERRLAALDQQLAVAAAAFRDVAERQKTIRDLLEVLVAKRGE